MKRTCRVKCYCESVLIYVNSPRYTIFGILDSIRTISISYWICAYILKWCANYCRFDLAKIVFLEGLINEVRNFCSPFCQTICRNAKQSDILSFLIVGLYNIPFRRVITFYDKYKLPPDLFWRKMFDRCWDRSPKNLFEFLRQFPRNRNWPVAEILLKFRQCS